MVSPAYSEPKASASSIPFKVNVKSPMVNGSPAEYVLIAAPEEEGLFGGLLVLAEEELEDVHPLNTKTTTKANPITSLLFIKTPRILPTD